MKPSVHQCYELRAGKDVQVWEIWVVNTDIMIRASGTGKRGRQTTHPHRKRAEALAEAQRMMAEKEAAGWRATLDAKGAPLRRAAERNPELEAAIVTAPDEPSNYLVYGDWLTEAGDPRGELVAVHAALDESPESKPFAKRLAELQKAHGRDWLGTLWGMERPSNVFFRNVRVPPNLVLSWRWGFVRTARFRDAFRVEQDLYAPFIRLAIAAFVRELTIEAPVTGERHLLPSLCTDPLPPLLRRLTLLLDWNESAVAHLAKHRAHLASLEELRVGVWSGSSPRDAMLEPLRKAFGKRVTFLAPADVER